MRRQRRIISALALACAVCLLIRYYSVASSQSSQQVLVKDANDGPLSSPAPWRDVFSPGTLKAPGLDYSRTVVMARLKADNVDWVDAELADILRPGGFLDKAIYVADDPHAELHPVKNKGHEAMVYLSYIIDNWEQLPDISIFVHADRWTWHNNELLDDDLAAMIRYLVPEKVVRDGYVNLRCHWVPGCPDWLHPGQATQEDAEKREELALGEHWIELFPDDDLPPVISQPCCAQFAVSSERIRAVPLSRYKHLQAWLLETTLDDHATGRMFEYVWQYMFTGNAVVCPAMHVCYCDGYGICFEGQDEFQAWFELRHERDEMAARIKQQAEKGDQAGGGVAAARARVDEKTAELRALRNEAFVRGGDAKVRAQLAGRDAR